MVVMAPSNEDECRKMLSTGLNLEQPSAIRYPRGQGPGVTIDKTLETLEVGKANRVRKGSQVAILNFGALLANTNEIANAINATVVDMRFVKPLDEAILLELAQTHAALVTLEDNAIAGGAGSAVSEFLAKQNIAIPCLHLGIPDCYVEHGSREECLADINLDSDGITQSIKNWTQNLNLSVSVDVA